ncbi:siderophore-interacting protein [Amycolatopsis kentuckyensis]|uniref:siderophore-interacting protein n=1 Tax=Amycolatopsis kentuckyensis TaxID=218823 RepID=UPI000A396500|nr:siderophore-interacting protein [Amycolatopsis kentuckyensis]
MLTLAVQGQERISPNFVSVTLGGHDVRHLEYTGFDQSGRLFFAEPGQTEVVLPSSEKWMLQQSLQSAKRRPRVRTYSIRRFRPDELAFDIEFSIHDQSNPARAAAPGTAWARAAKPGERVAFLDEGGGYVPTAGAGWQLLVGDESAVPAILAILEQSHDTLPAQVFLEVPTDADIRHEVTAPAATKIHWLPRNGSSLQPGSLALRTVRDAELPDGPFYTWVAGESSLATGIRRHLVAERNVPKSAVSFRGYWRRGRSALG